MNHKLSTLIFVFVVMSLVLSLTFSAVSQEKEIVLGTSIITYEHPFYIDVVNGMKKAAEEAGVEMLLDDPKTKLDAQVKALETYITRGVDAIVLFGVDPEGVVPVVEEAVAKGIPVITADMELVTDKVVTFIGSDNYQIGTEVGEWTKNYIEKEMDGKAKIGVLWWAVSVAQQQRTQGFLDQVTQLPGVEIVAQQNVEEGLRENAMTVAENIMTANKDIDFLFGGNQTCTMGAVSAVEAAGANIKVVGVDIDTEMVQAIRDGKLFATVAQQPIVLGSTAIETALNKLKGEEIPKRITIPVLLVSQENLEEATQALEILDY
jgi:ribose transport system substrate-binding protein